MGDHADDFLNESLDPYWEYDDEDKSEGGSGMGASKWVHLDVSEILRETEKAFLLKLESGLEVWVPKSQISDADIYSEGDRDATVSVSEWFAEKENLS